MEKKDLDTLIAAVSKAASKAASDTIEAELGQYKVPKEQHYQDHLWVTKMKDLQDTVQNSALKGMIGVAVLGLSSLLVFGLIFWGKQNL